MKLKIIKTRRGVKIKCLWCNCWMKFRRVPEVIECTCGKTFSVLTEGTFKADKIYTVFEHEMTEYPEAYWFWRECDGYIQMWCSNGIVYDVLKRDEVRHMYE